MTKNKCKVGKKYEIRTTRAIEMKLSIEVVLSEIYQNPRKKKCQTADL